MVTSPDSEHDREGRFWREEEKKEENFFRIKKSDNVKYATWETVGYKWSCVKV